MRERVADRAEAGGEDHVADLAHRRGGQRLLDVVLGAADDRTEQQRDRADDDDDELGVGRGVEDRRRTGRSGRRRR